MTFEIYPDKKGEWRWRLVAGNNKTVADSGEGYVHKSDCVAAVELIKKSIGPTTPVSYP